MIQSVSSQSFPIRMNTNEALIKSSSMSPTANQPNETNRPLDRRRSTQNQQRLRKGHTGRISSSKTSRGHLARLRKSMIALRQCLVISTTLPHLITAQLLSRHGKKPSRPNTTRLATKRSILSNRSGFLSPRSSISSLRLAQKVSIHTVSTPCHITIGQSPRNRHSNNHQSTLPWEPRSTRRWRMPSTLSLVISQVLMTSQDRLRNQRPMMRDPTMLRQITLGILSAHRVSSGTGWLFLCFFLWCYQLWFLGSFPCLWSFISGVLSFCICVLGEEQVHSGVWFMFVWVRLYLLFSALPVNFVLIGFCSSSNSSARVSTSPTYIIVFILSRTYPLDPRFLPHLSLSLVFAFSWSFFDLYLNLRNYILANSVPSGSELQYMNIAPPAILYLYCGGGFYIVSYWELRC